MNEVICQTRFESPFEARDSGISVYIANLNPESEYTISVRIDDVVKMATVSESDKTVTDKVSFYGLRMGEAYDVECDICCREEIKTFHTVMYAQAPPAPFSSFGRLGGGTLQVRRIAPKVEVL